MLYKILQRNIEPIDFGGVSLIKQDYESMTLSKLKEIAKELEIKNISKYKKNELIEEIISVSPNSIKKDGVNTEIRFRNEKFKQ